MRVPRLGRKDHRHTVPARVFLHRELVVESMKLIERHPSIEVGGKFLGYRIREGSEAPASPYGESIRSFWRQAAAAESILLVGSISSGPNAQATATSLVPDGRFQVEVFRRVERIEHDIEHLGSWHSHHPNGLRDFSRADRQHYTSLVVDDQYNEDVFIAGLCFGPEGLSSGLFDMYVRSAPDTPRRLGIGTITVVDDIPSMQDRIATVEVSVSGNLRTPQSRPDRVLSAMEAALRGAVRGEVNRITEPDSVSWVLTWPQPSGVTAVVTYTEGDPTTAAVSITLKSTDVELSLDSTGLPPAVQALHSNLGTIVRTLQHALQRASRQVS